MSKNRILLFYCLLALFFSQNSFGQNGGLGFNNFELSSEDGLQPGEIYHGFHSASGFIWILPANSGLYRYDGVTAKNYKIDLGEAGSQLNSIFEDDNGIIWLLSGLLGQKNKKAILFSQTTEKAETLESYFKEKLPFPEEELVTIQQNFDRTIWMTLTDGSIYEYDSSKIRYWGKTTASKIGTFRKYSDAIICTVSIDSSHSGINFSTPSGEALEFHALSNIADIAFLKPIEQDQSATAHLYTGHLSSKTKYKYLSRLEYGSPPITIDSTLNIGFEPYAVHNSYLFKISTTEINVCDANAKALFSFKKSADETFLFSDNQNGFWTTSGSEHLKRSFAFKSSFEQIKHPLYDDTWFRATRGITTGNDGDLYVAQGGRVLHVAKDGERSYLPVLNYNNENPDYFGLRLQKDKKYLWICEANAVRKYNLRTGAYEKTYQLEGELFFWQTYEDRQGTVWLGQTNGLYFIDPVTDQIQKFKSSDAFSKLESCSVYAFYENTEGMWIATSQGLYLMNQRKKISACYAKFKKGKAFIPALNIKHIQEDKDGSFWMATGGDGLLHWQPKTEGYDQYTTNNGLKDNNLYACYLDDFGQVWLPSNNGLMRFDKATKKIIHYTTLDGISDMEFNTISHFQGADGRLYFGGLNGVNQFHPKDFVPKKQEYPFRLMSIQTQDYEDKITHYSVGMEKKPRTILMTRNDKTVTLSFAFLNYKKPKTHKYSYKIEGFDKKWQALQGTQLQINGLPYGTYKLKVRVQTSGSDWHEYAYPITIDVVRPFYLRWWFFLLAFTLLLILVVLFIRWRLSRLTKRKNELETIVEERTSEILKQAEELKTLDKMKSQFFANISHELRTPVTLILGPLNVLRSERLSSMKEKQLFHILDLIDRNAQKLLSLIEEILELSKLSAGKIKLKPEPTDLKAFIKRIKISFDGMAQANNIKYRMEFEPSKVLSLMVDQDKLERIIGNFLLNAFKFTRPECEILLEVKETDDFIQISVKDDGIGIDQNDLPHIFERFYQSSTSERSAYGGTGIGLAICLEMTRLMNGTIWAESELGKGSQFFVKIPKIISNEEQDIESLKNKKNSAAPIPKSTASPKRKTILLVEDNEDLRLFIRSLLESQYNIITAKNGVEGIKILKEANAPDLIISDVMMPLMDGFQMLEQIKENDVWRSLPIMMLTARAEEEDKLFALTLGADDYLLKPFSNQELVVRVENLIKNYENRQLWKQEVFTAVKTFKGAAEKEMVEEEEGEEVTISKQDLLWMKQLEENVKKGFVSDQFDILTLADQMFLSRRQFERKIKKITGLTPAKLVMEIRLQKARELLENESFNTISEVSYAVGIQTPNYFTKLYTKRFGKKPRDYFT